MPTVASRAPGGAGQQIADERGGGQDRPGGDLTDGHSVEQLAFGEPALTGDEVGPQEGDQHVAAPVKGGPDLEEDQKHLPQAERGRRAGQREQREQAQAGRPGEARPPPRKDHGRAGGEQEEQLMDAQQVEKGNRRPQGPCEGARQGAAAEVP